MERTCETNGWCKVCGYFPLPLGVHDCGKHGADTITLPRERLREALIDARLEYASAADRRYAEINGTNEEYADRILAELEGAYHD